MLDLVVDWLHNLGDFGFLPQLFDAGLVHVFVPVVHMLCDDRGSVLDSVLALCAAQVVLVEVVHIAAASDAPCCAMTASSVFRAAAAGRAVTTRPDVARLAVLLAPGPSAVRSERDGFLNLASAPVVTDDGFSAVSAVVSGPAYVGVRSSVSGAAGSGARPAVKAWLCVPRCNVVTVGCGVAAAAA